MTSIQNHETSYENGQKPYKHDSKRGKWEIPGDFFFACLNSSFTSSHFSSLMYIFFFYNDSLLITFLYYLLTIAVYVVPVFFMQSFLGQFSSSGYISVFRIAPFFKGLGYVILLLNFMVLTYVVLFAAVPLFYTVASLVHLPDILECRNNTWNTQNCSALTVSLDYDWNNLDYETMQKYKNLPSYEYYNFHLGVFTDRNYFYDEEDNKPLDTTFNWSIFACCLVIWAIVYYITTRDIDLIGKINRYMTLGLMAILLMFTIRALSTKQLIQSLGTIFDLSHIRIDGHLSAFITSPLICLHVFGRGWGIPLVMASHNKFNTNTSNLSWAVVLGNILITTACMFITTVFYGVLDSNVDRFHITFEHPLESIYVGFPAVFGLMKFPRFWLLLLFIMLTLSEVFGIVMQLSAFFTSFFDEFDEFRMLKKEITMGIIGFFVFTTTFYCSNHGYNFFRAMSFTQITLQGMIFLFLILVVMWIYGKERFQRDVFFMLGIKYPTHIINIVRFVVPLFLIITTLFGIGLTYSSMGRSPFYEAIAVTIIKVVPWILIPGYMVYSLVRATGPFMTKLRKLNRPTDWFPTEMEDRQRYESVLGSSDISHQLSVTVVEETGLVEDDQD